MSKNVYCSKTDSKFESDLPSSMISCQDGILLFRKKSPTVKEEN